MDFGVAQTFTQVTLDVGGSTGDYARGYELYVSNDAVTWTGPVASGTGATGIMTIVFPVQTSRFISVVQTGTSSGNWWSIAELNVYSGAVPTAPLPTSGWGATASVSGSSDVPANAIDGNSGTRFSTGTNQASGQTFQVDMRSPQVVAGLVMDSGSSSSDYARNYQVFASSDGTSWGSAIVSGTATASPITLYFAQTTTRYLKVVLTASASNWWSIAELSVLTPTTATPTASVLPRLGWSASASSSGSGNGPSNALDDNGSTRWSTGVNQANGQYLLVDMLAPVTFTKITLDAGSSSSSDYPRGYQVFVSSDGSSWGSAIATGSGSSQVTTITFPSQSGRYIKLVQTGTSSTNWWSVSEFNVYGVAPAVLVREGWTATASLNSSNAQLGIDGNVSTQWSTNTSQVNGQSFQIDMKAAQTFNEITLDVNCNPADYPRGYQVFASNSTSNWGSAIASGSGFASMIAIAFPPQSVRYLKVVQTSTASNYWGLAELNVINTNPAMCSSACVALGACHNVGTCDPSTGVCSNPAKTNGTSCNDGNACTQTDTCQSGVCTGSNPVTCTASDQCHVAGTCNTSSGVCSNPVASNGTTCSDGNACTQTDTCKAGVCTGGNPVTCTAQDQCHTAGTCDAPTGACSNPVAANGTTCSDGNACTQTDSCQAGACVGSNPVTCAAADQCHAAGVCDPTSGACTSPLVANGTSCNDGNACTQTDTCQAGTCTGSNPVTCAASDQCHVAGTCNPASGTCSNPVAANGTSCSDGNACTQTDTCQAGTCTGSNPVTCAAPDQCHTAGTCDPTSGTCSKPVKANGTSCSDGNACTQTDTCQAGTCTGSNPVTCAAPDQCHTAGTCDPTSGTCSNPAKANGTSCSDGNACTQTDSCQSGICAGSNPVTCAASDQCHSAGTCDPTSGVCSNPAKSDGTSCSDGNACTQTDTCVAGTCTGGNPVTCAASDQCHLAGVCNTTSGVCSNPAKSDGTACSDGNACTQTDTCVAGTCTGGNPVTCTASDQCHTAGVCNTTSGVCSNPTKTDGTSCSDRNACTQTDTCVAGTCTGGNPVTCTASDQCHTAGTCNTTTGACTNPTKTDGTSCSDGNACTQTDTCVAGTCTGGNPVTCTASDQCHTAGTCNTSTGVCSNPTKADGTSCSDGNACTQTDTCVSGTCTGGNLVTCAASDQCHTAGTCDTTSGTCSNPAKANGTSCSDGNACTQTDTCQSGVCAGGNPVTCTASDQCHTAGTCDPTNGTCSNPTKADGVSCSDGNACTQTDTCVAGTCTGGNPVTCTASDQCHMAGTCDSASGVCSSPTKSNGTVCNDGNACTQGDSCQSGVCAGSTTVTCTASDQCHAVGTCDPTTGVCSNPSQANGTSCSDGNSCTTGDSCQSGVCAPGTQTCVNLALTNNSFLWRTTPITTMDCSADKTAATPGDQVTFTSHITNTGSQITLGTTVTLKNNGTSTFTVQGFGVTLEYFSVTQNSWVPFAGTLFDNQGTDITTTAAPSLVHLRTDANIDGGPGVTIGPKFVATTQIAPGGTANWDFFPQGPLPPSVVKTIFDPTIASALRVNVRFDTPGGAQPQDSLGADVTSHFAGVTGDVTGAYARIVWTVIANRTDILGPSPTPLQPGDTVTLTGTVAAPPLGARPSGITDQQYLVQLRNDDFYGYDIGCAADGQATLGPPPESDGRGWHLAPQFPILDVSKTGPATGLPGQLLQYPVGVLNEGFGEARSISVTDMVDGNVVAGPEILPDTVVPSEGTGTIVSYQPPAARAPGPLTDTVAITWQDDNGNLYGPMSSSATTTLGVACESRDPQNLAPIVSAGPTQLAPLQSTSPPPTFTMKKISTGFNKPIAIGYHGPTGKMLMSVNYPTGEPHNLELVNADGSRQPFTSIHGLTDEVYFAIARDERAGKSLGGFLDGEILIGTGTPGAIARVSPDGTSILNPWVQLPNETGLLRGRLVLDRTGLYGGDLLVTTTTGHLWRVTETGLATLITTLTGGNDFEGVAVIPNDPTRYGPWAGRILVGDENSTTFSAVASDGSKVPYDLGIGLENIFIVPANENFFGVDFGGSALYGASASQFTGMVGDVLMTQEFGAGVYDVRWNGTSFVKTLLFSVVQWEGAAFGPAGIVEVPAVGVTLAGSATDDGCPESGTLTSQWTELSGPGPVTFADDRAPTTTAVFTNAGTYVLRLTASDGQFTTTSDTTVVVSVTGQPNQAPIVDAGPSKTVRLPDSVDLAGTASDDGQPSGILNVSWSQVSGPSPATIINATSAFTPVLFTDPGTYVFQLTATDGQLSSTATTTVTVNAEPSLAGANLGVALASAGPLAIGSNESMIAALTDSGGHAVSGIPIGFTVTGANPQTGTVLTDAAGMATFTYEGINVGTDSLSAETLGSVQVASSSLTVSWNTGGTSPALTQGWIGAPLHQAAVMGQVPITVAAGVTLTSGTVSYWPMSAPSQVHTLATGVSGGPGTTIATLDTTVLANGPWVIQLDAINSAAEEQVSLVSVTVSGDYKPGRVVVEVTDMTIPVPGIPVTVGRRYDSLEKDNVGDFGHGWSLTLGHPRLEVDPGHNVTITMQDNRRVTFDFQATSVTNSVLFEWLYGPGYIAEPGTYGSLTADGCPLMVLNAGQLVCFLESSLEYAPATYKYTDPFGRVFTMAATGEIKSITDRQQNTLTFTSGGITSNTGVGVTFARDSQGRITKMTSPPLDGGDSTIVYSYEYDAAGTLAKVDLPDNGSGVGNVQYTYSTDHRLLTTKDPRGNPARTSTYDDAGHLLTDTDALGNVTSYAYDLAARRTTITNPDNGTVQQTFDDRGLLLKEVDPLGRTAQHTYDANRNELTRTNALGEVSTFIYDVEGNQTSSANARGETTQTTYNHFAEPLTITDPTGHQTTITYDDRGVPTRFSDEVGTIITFVPSEHGLPLSVTDAAGSTAYLAYDDAGNLMQQTDRLGGVTQHVYDGVGRPTAIIDARGGTTRFAYNLRGPLSRKWDATPQANATSYGYDANLNIVSEVSDGGHFTNRTFDELNHLTVEEHADHTTTRYSRDFRGHPLTMTDEAGRTTTYEYDVAGQLTKTTFPDGAFTMRGYDALGRLVTATDERGNATRYEYEAACGCVERVTKVTDALGRQTTTSYDPVGRRASTTDAAGHTTLYVYDPRGRLTTTTYADATSEIDAYDDLGRRTSHTDQMGVVTRYGYDAESKLTSVTDMLGHVTQYAFDKSGNLTSITDANDRATTFAYDALNRRTGRTLPLGMSETWAYDMYGDVTTHVDFRGHKTSTSYDSRARLLTKAPDPTLGEPTVVFTYNPTGTRATMTDASGSTSYTYDARDRLLTKGTQAGTLTYSYDPAANLATIRSSNTNGTSVDYAWDAANQLISVTDNRANGVTTVAYATTGRPSTLTQPSGLGATYAYDSRNRVSSLTWARGVDPAIEGWTYEHNARGQRTGVTGVTGRHVAYGYDAVARLVSDAITSDPGGTASNGEVDYTLGPTGNRLTRTSTLAALGNQTFAYDANDELTGDSYDVDGNTISTAGGSFAYDFENRLVSKDGGAVTVVYDGDGNRVAKTVGGVTTKYLVDGLNPTRRLQVLEELSGGAVQLAYTYGTTLVSQRRVAAGGAVSYYGYDAHGSVAFLADSTGHVTDAYEYDAWGNVVAQQGTTPNTRLYTGEEFDPDLNVVNLRARYYQPDRGRFLTLDQAAGDLNKPLSFNRYLYTSVDPVNTLDPTGHTEAGEEETEEVEALVAAPKQASEFQVTIKTAHAVNQGKHFLDLADQSTAELEQLIDTAAREILANGNIAVQAPFASVIPLDGYDLWFNGFLRTEIWLEVTTYYLRF